MVDICPCSYRESTDPFLKGTNKLVVGGIEKQYWTTNYRGVC